MDRDETYLTPGSDGADVAKRWSLRAEENAAQANEPIFANPLYQEEDFTISIPVLHLVLADKIEQEMSAKKQKYPYWPGSVDELEELLQSFYSSAHAEDGLTPRIPVLIKTEKEKKDKKHLWLCTRSYYLKLSSSRQGDSYIVFGISRLTLREHDELSRGAVKLQVDRWHVHINYSMMNSNYKVASNSNEIQKILDAWERLEQYKKILRDVQHKEKTPLLSQEQEYFLHQVEDLVKISLEREQAKQPRPYIFFYDNVQATDVSRQTRDDVYKFHLSRSIGNPQVDMFVQLKEHKRIRGKIIRVEDDWFTIRFGREIDKDDVDPINGPFETVSMQSIYRVQRDAIEALRTQSANNRSLLNVLVDSVYQNHEPTTEYEGDPSLNEQQKKALQNALMVKDVLLIQGPPGTGKTYTINSIVQHYRKQKQRILVTARTHKAVDNVLEQLIDSKQTDNKQMVLRVGYEDKISFESKGLLIEAQAQIMQRNILDNTRGSLSNLEKLNSKLKEIEHCVDRIDFFTSKLNQSQQLFQDIKSKNEKIDQGYLIDFEEAEQQHHALLQSMHDEYNSYLAELKKLYDRQKFNNETYEDMCEIELTAVGELNKQKLKSEIENNGRNIKTLEEKARQVNERIEQEQQEYHRTINTYKQRREKEQKAGKACALYVQTVYRQIRPLLETAHALNMDIIKPEGLTPIELIEYLRYFQREWPDRRTQLEQRYQVLSRWHRRIDASADELHPILIRRADIIGATCIGSATAHVLADVDFDLVIVDEAGQINMLDLLVPLVKGKRTVLVGDHKQLPPLVDNDVYRRVCEMASENTEDMLPDQGDASGEDEQETNFSANGQHIQKMKEMLEKSVFELLFESARAAPGHMITLTEQHRMPELVANFVSEHFYEKTLDTAKEIKVKDQRYTDRLFSSPLVFIDTAHLPLDERRESRDGDITEEGDSSRRTSYTNPKEAEIIVRLITTYLSDEQEWAVIVPYRAQADYIRSALRDHLQSQYNPEFDENIATVDSFQGGQRANIIYGFTRSNSERRVGFLGELRRLNVALTRVRQQLVLVGDSMTLTRARDLAFRQLIKKLLVYIKKQGGIHIHYGAFIKTLTERELSDESET